MKRIALPLSVGLILAYWLYSFGGYLLRSGESTTPASVSWLALYVCVKTAVVVVVVVPLLRANGERLADLGFGVTAVRGALLRGLLFAIALFIVLDVIGSSLLSSAGIGGGGTSPAVVALFRDPREAPLWVFCAVVGGGFNEELVRAFILTRFERAFGRWGLRLAIAVDGVEFGLGHLYQGPSAAITSGLFAVLASLIFLRRRRVADAMVAHAVYDLIGVAAAYALFGGQA
jgi:membrane protease YdiL (CAAX protease family)